MTLNKQFLPFAVSVFLVCSGAYAVLSITSSINIEDGLGTISGAVAYISSVVAAFFVPMLIENVGCRYAIIIAELCFLLYIISNVYSSFNVIVGGIFLGFGEACMWTACPIACTIFASKHSNTGSKTEATYNNHYIGYLFTVLQASLVFGNAVVFLILYVDRSLSSQLNITHHVNYWYCGANDCQEANVTMENLEQYSPAHEVSLYIVISFFSVTAVIAMAVLFFCLPDDKPTVSIPSNLSRNALTEENTGVDDDCDDSGLYGRHLSVSPENRELHGCLHLKFTITESLRLLCERKHLLIVLLPIYNGLLIGFILGELTRAFAACIHGLDKIGVGIVIAGAADAFSCYVVGKVAGKYGRNIPFVIAFILDIASYIFCLMWVITPDNSWLAFILFLIFGITDGVWETLINVMYVEYFPEKQKIAVNLWNVLVNIGTALQFAISTSLCVNVKIYIQIAMLCIGILTYSLSQYIYYRPRKKTASCNNGSELISELNL